MELAAQICQIVLILAIPFVVNLVKSSTWSSSRKRFIGITTSIIGGLATTGAQIAATGAFDPNLLFLYVLSTIGGVQMTYALFSAIGVTSRWLDALEGIGRKGEE